MSKRRDTRDRIYAALMARPERLNAPWPFVRFGLYVELGDCTYTEIERAMDSLTKQQMKALVAAANRARRDQDGVEVLP